MVQKHRDYFAVGKLTFEVTRKERFGAIAEWRFWATVIHFMNLCSLFELKLRDNGRPIDRSHNPALVKNIGLPRRRDLSELL